MAPANESPSGHFSPSDASANTSRNRSEAKADPLHQPHDKLFKANFRDIPTAIAFFKNYLPPRIVRQLDLARIKIVPGSHITGELKASESDLLFRVGLKNSPAEALVYLPFSCSSPPRCRDCGPIPPGVRWWRGRRRSRAGPAT